MRRAFLFLIVFFLLILAACEPTGKPETLTQSMEEVKVPTTNLVFTENELGGFWLRTSEQPILATDPITAEPLLSLLDSEVTRYFKQVDSREYGSLSEQLADMVHIDQTMRNMSIRNPIVFSHFPNVIERDIYRKNRIKIFDQVDENNTAILKSILEGRGWLRDDNDGEGAARSGWLIVQHADRDAKFQEVVLKKMEVELGAPGVTNELYAYLHDRVSVRPGNFDKTSNRTQRFGTQGRCNFEKEVWEPLPLVDEERVDRWRAQMGLEHLDDYKERFNCKKALWAK